MRSDPQAAYDELIQRARELATLASCSALLGWDEQTYMPRGGSAHRGSQMAVLAGLYHERATDPRLGDFLQLVEGSNLVSEPESDVGVNVRELRRSYDRRVLLPKSLVEELARTTSLAQGEWVVARSENDFARLRPWLERIFQLKRQESACLKSGFATLGEDVTPDRNAPAPTSPLAGAKASEGSTPVSVYDPLVDQYEPGARSAELAVLFQELRGELMPLVSAIAEASRRQTLERVTALQPCASAESCGEAVLRRFFPRDRQKVFGEGVAAAVGFDFSRGRLDVTAHPFCSGIGPGDCRITTRYDEHHFNKAFSGILHEVGHGLYEQGLDGAHYGTPMGEAVSLGVHESQARLWENAVGRSHIQPAHHHPLRARAGIAQREFAGRRPPRGLEPEVPGNSGAHAP